jgi:hypothetical protein
MRVAIDVNGVLRDTIKKIEQVYEKWYIENPHLPESGFTYEILSPITSLDISSHLKFENEDEVYDFLYTEHCMEVFGHAPSVAMNTFIDFDEFYKTNREKHDILIISDEIGRSKPATLFFLSKFGCQVEKVVFYSKMTVDKIWEEFDVLLTANPDLLLSHPQDKKVIKFETVYNSDIDFENSIDTLKSLNDKILELE